MNPAPHEASPDCALSACRDGECFLVETVRGAAAARLRDVGVREGARLTVLQNSGDVVVRVSCSRVCLRKELAQTVLGSSVPA